MFPRHLKTYATADATIWSFVGQNRAVLQEGPLLFSDISNADVIVPCNGTMEINFADYDWVNLDDYSSHTTFAILISP